MFHEITSDGIDWTGVIHDPHSSSSSNSQWNCIIQSRLSIFVIREMEENIMKVGVQKLYICVRFSDTKIGFMTQENPSAVQSLRIFARCTGTVFL